MSREGGPDDAARRGPFRSLWGCVGVQVALEGWVLLRDVPADARHTRPWRATHGRREGHCCARGAGVFVTGNEIVAAKTRHVYCFL
jgi:hypothetical protein